MPRLSITANATELCQRLLIDPHVDEAQRSLARQLLAFVESFCSDQHRDPFYEACIHNLALDIAGQSQ